MYKVMLAFDNYELLKEVENLHIWGDVSEFNIVKVVRDGNSAYSEMRKQKFDLVVAEINLSGLDALQLLRMSKSESLCDHIVLCSEFSNFDYARHGIILGAFDYFVKPFDENLFYSMFSRIKNEAYANGALEILYTEKLISYFENHDNGIYEYIDNMLSKIYSSGNNELDSHRSVQQIYKTVVEEIFDKNDWLDLYISQESMFAPDLIMEGNSNSYKMHYRNKLYFLFDEYLTLFPNTSNDKIKEVILYILYNPESDLKQKTIADNFYINSSYLSTVFSAHTDIRFVEYLTIVKMKRAGWLLRNTNMKIVDISSRLYYKDIGYFARLFKKHYNTTPSEYRIPENYSFEI
jgi:two-component system response regulator YesN